MQKVRLHMQTQRKTKAARKKRSTAASPDLLLNANIRITSVIKKTYDKIYSRNKQVVEESWEKEYLRPSYSAIFSGN